MNTMKKIKAKTEVVVYTGISDLVELSRAMDIRLSNNGTAV
jgi:hypothetical protein